MSTEELEEGEIEDTSDYLSERFPYGELVIHDAASLEASLVSKFERDWEVQEEKTRQERLKRRRTSQNPTFGYQTESQDADFLSSETSSVPENDLLSAKRNLVETESGSLYESKEYDTSAPFTASSRQDQDVKRGSLWGNDDLLNGSGNEFTYPHFSGENLVPKTKLLGFPVDLPVSKPRKKSSSKQPQSKLSFLDTESTITDDATDAAFKKRLCSWLSHAEPSFSWTIPLDNEEKLKLTDTTEPFTDLSQVLERAPAITLDEHLHVPIGLWNALLPYQQEAVSFLWSLHQKKTGGILADEMGLGKTVELIAFFAALHFTTTLKNSNSLPERLEATHSEIPGQSTISSLEDLAPILSGGILLVCPATVVQQWLCEFHRWYPPLRCVTVSGKQRSERRRLVKRLAARNVVLLVSYETVRTDVTFMVNFPFQYIVLDEGQKIRNPEAGITMAVKKFPTTHRLILSGTPIQNDLRELWSLFDFVAPHRLGSLTKFTEHFADPIRLGGLSSASREAAYTAYASASALRSIIAPHLLRRTKAQLSHCLSLPNKAEQVVFCHLSPIQFQLYVEFIEGHSPFGARRRLSSQLMTPYIFFALSVLRKLCNHPDLLLLHQSSPDNVPDFGALERSGKLQVVLNVLRSWKNEHHRVLLFSQTLQVLDLLEVHLKHEGYSFRRLDGMTPLLRRQAILAEFHHDKTIFILLMTTRVGGVGLNVTAANRVLIFDPDWNPMTDAQARERSWRIGQTKDVVIYRLITGGTIEEKIYQRQIFKFFLSQRILVNPKQKQYFKLNDLRELFQLPPCPPTLKDPQIVRALTSSSYHQRMVKAIQCWAEQNLVATVADAVPQRDEKHTVISQNVSPFPHTPTVVDSEDTIPKRQRIGSSAEENDDATPIKTPPKRTEPIETETIGLQYLGYKSKKKSAVRPKQEEHTLLNTLLDHNGIQGFLSHDFFETSHVDFDLERKKSLERSFQAVRAIGADPASVPMFYVTPAPPLTATQWTSQQHASPETGQNKTLSLMEQLRQQREVRSTSKSCDEAWTTAIRQKLDSFFLMRGPSTTDAILDMFAPDVYGRVVKHVTLLLSNPNASAEMLQRAARQVLCIRREKNNLNPPCASMVVLKVLGAGRHVGRSAAVVDLDGCTLLFDCGIQITNSGKDRFPELTSLFRPEPRPARVPSAAPCDDACFTHPVTKRIRVEPQSAIPATCSLPVFPKESYRCLLDFVLITHSHLDHIGALPYLTEVLGYSGPVFMTASCYAQAKLQLQDCWLNQQYQSQYSGLSCETTGSDSNELFVHSVPSDFAQDVKYWTTPLTSAMIDACLKKVVVIPFSESVVVRNIRIVALPAGHVPGACMFLVEGLDTGYSVLYTGDYTTDGEQLMQAAQVPVLHPTLLISEATYGSQVRESKRATERELCCIVEAVVRQGGKVLIPVSGMGKSQELALLLALHCELCGLAHVPIILGSGMMERAMNVLTDSFRDWSSQQVDALNAISFMDVKTVLRIPSGSPAVYFCAPRTLAAGPSLQMLRAWGTDPKNLILLVGFSVPGTVAYQIIKGSKVLKLPPAEKQLAWPTSMSDPSQNMVHSEKFSTEERKSVTASGQGLAADSVSNGKDNEKQRICYSKNVRAPDVLKSFRLQAKMRYLSLASHADSLAIQHFVKYTSPLMTVLVHGEAEGIMALTTQLHKNSKRPVWAPRNNETIVVQLGYPSRALTPFIIRQTLQSLPLQEQRHPTDDGTLEVADTSVVTLQDALAKQSAIIRKWLDARWERCKVPELKKHYYHATSQGAVIPHSPEKSVVGARMSHLFPFLLDMLDVEIPRFLPIDRIERQTLQFLYFETPSIAEAPVEGGFCRTIKNEPSVLAPTSSKATGSDAQAELAEEGEIVSS